MGIFTADEMQIFGKRGIRLTYKLNEHDREPKLISLFVEHELEGYQRWPAAYEFIEATAQRPWPIIRVVAAPGVSALLHNIGPEVRPDMPNVEIYRVQDPELVPPMAVAFAALSFVGQDELNPQSSPFALAPHGSFGLSYPTNYFVLSRLRSGIVVEHPASHQALTVVVDEYTDLSAPLDSPNARARFAYEFNPQGILDSTDQPFFKIVKTPAVRIITTDRVFLGTTFPRGGAPHYFQVFEVDDINSVPPQGYTIEPQSGWREVRSFERVRMPDEEPAMMLADFGISLSPASDLVDIAEFVYALNM